jgi:hypothetical protein
MVVMLMRKEPIQQEVGSMVRALGRQRVVAGIVMVAIASVGMQPIVAASQETQQSRDTARPNWQVQVLNAQGRFVDLATTVSAEGVSQRTQLTTAQIEQLRLDLTGLKFGTHPKFGMNPKMSARADRLLTILDIWATANRAERRAKIQQLGVTITEAPSTDGREGTIKTFSANGEARARLFIPTRNAHTLTIDQEPEESSASGPSVVNETGRWKEDGEGGCYWDANDDGDDQCSPTVGRWKISGSDCYWDANDSGPNQCEPPPPPSGPAPVCYFNDQPDTCATVQDGEDAMALAVALAGC